jgi:apolipoprotein D and lipocalin family protein
VTEGALPHTLKMKNNKLPNPTLQEEFNVSRYLGDWYELYRSANIRFEKGTDIVARYGSDPKHADRMTVTNLQTLDNGKIDTITGYAVRKSENLPAADLTFKMNCFLRGKYQILRTDYDTYSVVYSSRKILFGLLKKEYCWILARKREVINDAELIDGLFKTIEEETGMTREEFIKSPTSQ